MKRAIGAFMIFAILCVLATGCLKPDNEDVTVTEREQEKQIIVIDAGHGKSSSAMNDTEKTAEGFTYDVKTGRWGEWRHFKNGTYGIECEGEGCTHNGGCFYPMVNGDRDTEPEINLANALAAKKYLEEIGYEVRLTRSTNDELPSMNKRVSYCFPDNNILAEPDASLYVCLHSNAGGGRGTAYIALEGGYTQLYIPDDYVEQSNTAGEIINKKISEMTGLTYNTPIMNEGYLVLFNKCPVPIAYMEIGYYDNEGDLELLKSSSEKIGMAIAEGVAEYLEN